MKKLMMKFGNLFAALALVATTLNVNSTCSHYIYQAPIPESAKKLSKIR
ncbi:MAG: cyclic lactone autoinducer peptide [Firmicutes bacterium]|nr:cyclic lactone autoinducer peptide [Bacillota bacterium]NBI64854.1 cyclic lactone autoinducer peptide [Clostridiales bacterium]